MWFLLTSSTPLSPRELWTWEHRIRDVFSSQVFLHLLLSFALNIQPGLGFWDCFFMVFISVNPSRVWRQKKFLPRLSDNFGSAYSPERPKTFVRPRSRAPASVPPDSFFFCHCCRVPRHSPSLFFSRQFDDEVHHLLNICTKRRLGWDAVMGIVTFVNVMFSRRVQHAQMIT